MAENYQQDRFCQKCAVSHHHETSQCMTAGCTVALKGYWVKYLNVILLFNDGQRREINLISLNFMFLHISECVQPLQSKKIVRYQVHPWNGCCRDCWAAETLMDTINLNLPECCSPLRPANKTEVTEIEIWTHRRSYSGALTTFYNAWWERMNSCSSPQRSARSNSATSSKCTALIYSF